MEYRQIMSVKELKRKTILEHVLCGKITLKDAASLMEITYRQAKRIKKSYLENKDKGLQHRNRGKIPCKLLFKRI